MKHSSIIAIKNRCKGNDVFNFSKVDVTEIENETLKLNEKKKLHKIMIFRLESLQKTCFVQ